MTFLEFTFQNAWHFFGVAVLITITGNIVRDIIRTLKK
jgi:hypothetical protein